LVGAGSITCIVGLGGSHTIYISIIGTIQVRLSVIEGDSLVTSIGITTIVDNYPNTSEVRAVRSHEIRVCTTEVVAAVIITMSVTSVIRAYISTTFSNNITRN
jgi:hypothetical protein